MTVTGIGSGGRNQELALAAARDLQGHRELALLTAGIYGVDGPTGTNVADIALGLVLR